jgi:hypothetical protein
MALRDIIKGLDDDAQVQIGEQQIRVGDIRSEFYDPEKYVSRSEWEKVNAERDQMSTGVLNFLNRAAASTEQDMNRPPAAPAEPPPDPRSMFKEAVKGLFADEGYDYSKDQYVGPAMTKAEERAYERALKKAEEIYGPKISELDQRLQATTRQAILAEENSWFNQNQRDLPLRPDKQRYSLENLRQLALANRVVDERGYPDYNRLKEALLEPDRRQKEVTDKEEAAYKRGLSDARKAAGGNIIDVPGRGFVPVENVKPPVDVKGKSQDQIFREALNLAFTDDDIQNMSTGRFTNIGQS